VNGNNRRVDFGVCSTAAADNKHSQNAKIRWINSSELSNQMIDSAETLKIISVDGTGDAAAVSNNMGASGDIFSIIFSGHIVGNMVDN
jgi:hypothetical protein